jgi:hypothetical protein
MPAVARHRSTTAGSAATLTPSASNRSALPHLLDADRLPCLATGTPQAATTRAATVETLNVCDRSPPVPQVSNTGACLRDSFVARFRMVCANPTISAGRSPFMDSAISRPAICAGWARPSMISSIAADASSVVRSWRRWSFSMSGVNI